MVGLRPSGKRPQTTGCNVKGMVAFRLVSISPKKNTTTHWYHYNVANVARQLNKVTAACRVSLTLQDCPEEAHRPVKCPADSPE